jgi:hypothetical protein
MRTQLVAPLVFAVLTTTITANAITNKPPHSRTIVVQSPSDTPVLAQANSEAMYLDKRGDGRAVLYVESAEGSKLTALDVSDPAKIQRLAETELGARSQFDFVESVGNDSALVRYRDGSGEALLNFKHWKHPVLSDAAALTGTEVAEKLGETALLSASTNAAVAPIVDGDPTYKVWDDSKASHPNLLATIPGVRSVFRTKILARCSFLARTVSRWYADFVSKRTAKLTSCGNHRPSVVVMDEAHATFASSLTSPCTVWRQVMWVWPDWSLRFSFSSQGHNFIGVTVSRQKHRSHDPKP